MKRTGFTLIELMVVIVIILILLGIGAGVGQWQSRRAEIDLTRTALESLNSIAIEMQVLGMGIGGSSLDTTAEIVARAKTTRSLKPMLSGIPENLFTGSTVKDSWGQDIFFAKNGTALSGVPPRGDGLFYFASKGPDSQWGNYAGSEAQKTQEADNLYSYEVN